MLDPIQLQSATKREFAAQDEAEDETRSAALNAGSLSDITPTRQRAVSSYARQSIQHEP